jgi:ArsR family transcriptional regulator
MRKPPPIYRQMSVLGDPLRTRPLLLLERNELGVGELCAITQTPQPTVSRHLKALSDASWVASRSEGTNRRYAMLSHGLDPAARSLWLLVRKEAAATARPSRTTSGSCRSWRSGAPARRSSSARGASQWDGLRDELFGRRFFLPALLALLDDDARSPTSAAGPARSRKPWRPTSPGSSRWTAPRPWCRAAKRRLEPHGNVEIRPGALERLPIDDASLGRGHHVPCPAPRRGSAARASPRRAAC